MSAPAVELGGRVLTPGGPVAGTLVLEGGRVAAVRPGPAPDRWLLPGFVDLHVHGGGGADVMDGPDAVQAVAAFHLRHGTTALCPTTVTRPPDELVAFLTGLRRLTREAAPGGGARLLGAHLEGPFIAPTRLGAQPAHARPPEVALLLELLQAGPVAAVTLAPELAGALELIRLLRARGLRASLGHREADYVQARAAVAAGADGATHLFNAMTGLGHRAPGLAAAALEAEQATLELILDGHHVHPALFRLAHRAARGRLALVSDAIRAAGLPDGPSELGGQQVVVQGGRACLRDGTLAGSVLTLDQALRNAVAAGLTVEEASHLVSRNPARALGRAGLGELFPGAWGDVVEMDDALRVRRVWVGGEEVE